MVIIDKQLSKIYGSLLFNGGDVSDALSSSSLLFILAYRYATHSCFAGTSLHYSCTCLCEPSRSAALLIYWVRFGKVHLRFSHPLSTISSRKRSGNQVVITSRGTSKQPHGFEIIRWSAKLALHSIFP